MIPATFTRVVEERLPAPFAPDDSDARLLARFRHLPRLGRVRETGREVLGPGLGRLPPGRRAALGRGGRFSSHLPVASVRQIDRIDIERPLGPWLHAVAWRGRPQARVPATGGSPRCRRPEGVIGRGERRDRPVNQPRRRYGSSTRRSKQSARDRSRQVVVLCCLEGVAARGTLRPRSVARHAGGSRSRLERARESAPPRRLARPRHRPSGGDPPVAPRRATGGGGIAAPRGSDARNVRRPARSSNSSDRVGTRGGESDHPGVGVVRTADALRRLGPVHPARHNLKKRRGEVGRRSRWPRCRSPSGPLRRPAYPKGP